VAAQQKPDYDSLLEVGDEALWIWSHALIARLDADFEFIPVNLLAGEHKHPDFLRLNPAGKVPVLVDGDIVIPESAAIVLYLAGRGPVPLPQCRGLLGVQPSRDLLC
jgi:glutathione S-transferase